MEYPACVFGSTSCVDVPMLIYFWSRFLCFIVMVLLVKFGQLIKKLIHKRINDYTYVIKYSNIHQTCAIEA